MWKAEQLPQHHVQLATGVVECIALTVRLHPLIIWLDWTLSLLGSLVIRLLFTESGDAEPIVLWIDRLSMSFFLAGHNDAKLTKKPGAGRY